MAKNLDEVDRGILYLLQRDARHTTAADIAEHVGVSASTVRNRIDRLEAEGVIEGYRPVVDYERASFPLRTMFVITAPPTEREEYGEKLMEVDGVIGVREVLTGRRNVYAEVVGTLTSDIARITDAIHELGLEIEDSDIVRKHRVQPFNHLFFQSALEDSGR